MLNRTTIKNVHWQMARAQAQPVWGGIATDLADLHQEIRQCILTPKGSVPLNPEKGCDLDQFRDRPMNVRSLFVVDEVREALRRWVPRIRVDRIDVEAGFSQISLRVTWSPVEGVAAQFEQTEVDYAF